MIKYDYEITVNGNQAKLNKDIYLFRGNKNVHYYFAVKNASFNFKGSTDLIEKTNAINAAVTVIKPNNVEVASAIAKVENGKIHLKVTEDLIDEEVEVGDFDLVFDLFDDTDGAVTIPKVIGQFHVLERPCTTPISELVATNTTNEVDQALTDYAIVTYAEPVASTNADGTFAKKTWVAKEKITTAELNRMEEGISDVSSQCKENQINLIEDDTSMEGISDTVHDTLETEDKRIIGGINEVNRKVKDITKQVENVGQPTQEQINTAINKAIQDGKITGGGINSTAKTLLETILKNAIYTTNQSANITALMSALGNSESGGDTPSVTYYNITNNLTNCTNGNITSTVAENTSYSCTITANKGYKLDTVTVTMGGVDITSTAYSNGNITISKVTGNIVITGTATEKQAVAEMPTNGLVDLFDFRKCQYDNGDTTKIKATKGNGGLYGWFKSGVEAQDAKYGIKSSKTYSYSTDYSTNGASANSSFTQVFMSYFGTNTGNNPFFNPSWGKLCNVGALTFTPKYIDTTGASKQLANEDISGSRGGWFRIILSVDATTKICKLYVNDRCVSTHDGNSITDFKNWSTSISMKLLNINKNGGYYMTQFALYNKALSEVEVTEAMTYLKTLEVA